MPDELRRAYVARLLRSIALAYGVGAEFGRGALVGETHDGTVGGIVRRLNDIPWMPCIDAGARAGDA